MSVKNNTFLNGNLPMAGDTFLNGIKDEINNLVQYFLDLDPANREQQAQAILVSNLGGLGLKLEENSTGINYIATFNSFKKTTFPGDFIFFNGMSFDINNTIENTGSPNITILDRGPYNILNYDGEVLQAGEFKKGVYKLIYNQTLNSFLLASGTGGGGSSRNIGELVQSTLPQNDATLHLLDGSLILAGGSYDAFYLYMKDLYDGGLYPDLFETEANWQASVSTYGVCGKFVFEDGVSVRIPKMEGFTEGTINPTDLGNLTEAGLPNITGGVNNVAFDSYKTSNVDGAFNSITNVSDATDGSSSAERHCNFTFSASASNSIYGNSTTVQPQSIKVLYYVCVATAVKTGVAVDIDNIMTDLSAIQHGSTIIFDTLNNTAKQNIFSLTKLDYSSPVTVSTAVTETYTATQDGALICNDTGAERYMRIKYNDDSGIILASIDASSSSGGGFILPVYKDQKYYMSQRTAGMNLYFVPNVSQSS